MGNKVEPYVGPRPFGRDDASIFFGRDREASELMSLIIAHPVVLIYAQSGAGKTSLLSAKVIPLLEARRSEVFGSARVSGDLPQGLRSGDVKNIYVFNALLSLQKDLPDPACLSQETLPHFFGSRTRAAAADGVASRRIIIFDQFEEIFTTTPERWQDRTDFFDNVGAALEADPGLRVVFAMREEYIASMDPFASILPERLRTRFRLERLREEAALEAVKKPLEGTGRSFAPGAAEKLVRNLLRVPIKSATGTVDISGEYVEPVQLQVVCKNLWQSLPAEVEVIDEKYIADYGDVDRALSAYYDDCVARAAEEKHVREGELRRWFGKVLITSDGTRGTVYKDVRTTGGLPNDVVDMLEDVRLVRPELRGGAPWYELTHDRFIAPIIKSNEDWFNRREAGLATSHRLEGSAERWALTRGAKPEEGLLAKEELAEAAEWIKGPDAEELGVSDLLREFVRESQMAAERRRAEKQSRIARGLRRQRTFLTVAVILAALAAAYAVYAQVRESRARRQAENAKLSERGNIAATFSGQRGKEFDGLVLGVKAVEVIPGEEPPPEAVEGLRQAVAAAERSVWLRKAPAQVEEIEFSVDGRRVMTQSKGRVCVFDSATGELLFNHEVSRGGKWSETGLSPDGEMAFALEEVPQEGEKQEQAGEGPAADGERPTDEKTRTVLRLWEMKTRTPLETYTERLPQTVKLMFSRNGARLLAYSSDNWLRVLDAKTGGLLFEKPDLKIVPEKLAFSPEGTRIVTFSREKKPSMELWDADTGGLITRLRKFRAGEDPYYSTSFSDDDSRLLLAPLFSDKPKRGSLWDAKAGAKLFDLPPTTLIDRGMIESGGGRIVLFSSSLRGEDIKAYIFDEASGELLKENDFETSLRYLNRLAVTVRSFILGIEHPYMRDYEMRYYFGSFYEREEGEKKPSTVVLWDALTDEKRALIEGYPAQFKYVTAARNLERIATVAADEAVQVWEVNPAPRDIAAMPVARLKELACARLRYQDEFAQVEGLCR